MRKLYALLLAAFALVLTDVSAQTILYSEDFNSGGGGFTLNTPDLGGGGASNTWIVNSSYFGGGFNIDCSGIPFPATILDTPNEPAGITNSPQSGYLHITSFAGLMNGVDNCHFMAADGFCNFTETMFSRMTSSISTTGQTGVTVNFWWLCDALPGSSYGEVYYSTDNGASWNPIPGGLTEYSGQASWTQASITSAALDNQPSIMLGFRFVTTEILATANDPAFAIDDVQITATPTTGNSITTDNILAGPYCPGQAVSVPFTATGTFNAGNTFTAQLSNSAGSFVTPVVIGTLSGTSSGVINANIPLGTAAGSNYQIRVVANSPSTTGTASVVTITVGGAPTASISNASSSTVCSGGTANLIFQGSSGTIQWSSSTNNVSFTPIVGATSATYTTLPLTQTTYFQATVTSSCGATTSSSWTVTLTNQVVIPLTYSPNTLNLCNGNINVSVNGSFTGLTWSNGQTGTSTIGVTTPMTISVTGQTATGCPAASAPLTFILTTPPALTVTPVSPVTLCGPSATLTASPGFATYSWSNGQTGSTTSVTSAGTYIATGVDADGCIVNSTPVQVVTGASVNIPVSPSLAAICDGEPAVIIADPGFSNYEWSNGALGQTITVSQTGYFSVTATDANGCPGSSALVEVIQSQYPIANFTYTQNSGYTVGFDNNSQNGLTFEWAFDSIGTSPLRDPSFTFPESGPYEVTLIISNPCGSDTITKTIIVAQVGIQELSVNDGIEVYPNPSQNDFVLHFSNPSVQVESLQLCDISGKMIYQLISPQKDNTQIILSGNSLAKGIYFLKINTLAGQKNIRLIKS